MRLRQRVTKGPGSRAAGIAMAYKLIEARWRKVNAPELVALVRAGAIFHKGKLLERTAHRHHPGPDAAPRRDRRIGGRLKPNPQVLTIPHRCSGDGSRNRPCAWPPPAMRRPGWGARNRPIAPPQIRACPRTSRHGRADGSCRGHRRQRRYRGVAAALARLGRGHPIVKRSAAGGFAAYGFGYCLKVRP